MNNKKPKSPHTALEDSQKRVRDYIYRNAKDGSWAYHPDQTASTEATAWCALSLDAKGPHLPAALNYLVKTQNQDGGWSTGPDEGKSDWCSGPALFALRSASLLLNDDKSHSSFDRGVTYLNETKFDMTNVAVRILLGAIQGKDPEDAPRGWPWSKGCFHWVEPTSYNLYACKLPMAPNYSKETAKVVERATQWILDNPCSIGGWNHGSHLSLGVNLPPMIVPTAEALLALQDSPTHKEVKRGFDFLDANSTEASEAGQQKSAMALSWMILANHAYGRETDKLISQLVAIQKSDDSFGPNMMTTALASMALGTANGVNPFKMKKLDSGNKNG